MGWLAQSLHEMQCVRVVCDAGTFGNLWVKMLASLVRVWFSEAGVNSTHEPSD